MRVWRITCQVKKLDTSTNFCSVCISVYGARVMYDLKKAICTQLYAEFHNCFCLALLLPCMLCLQLHLFKDCSINLTY